MQPALIPLDARPVPSGGKRRVTPKGAKTHAYRARCPTCKGAPPADPDDKCKDCITIWALYGTLISRTLERVLRRDFTAWTVAGPLCMLTKAFEKHGRHPTELDAKGKRRQLSGVEFDAWLDATLERWLRWRAGVLDVRELPERLKVPWLQGETPKGWVGWLNGGGAR